MTNPKQPSFFDQTHEDLPLISGTSQRAAVRPFAPKPKPKQSNIPVNCKACLDTGLIGGKRCWCSPQLEKRQELAKTTLALDIASLTSGTIANLIGDSRYSVIDTIQYDFIGWINGRDPCKKCDFKNWQEAWEAYWPQCSFNKLVTGYAVECGIPHYFQAGAVVLETDTADETATAAYEKAYKQSQKDGVFLPDPVDVVEFTDVDINDTWNW